MGAKNSHHTQATYLKMRSKTSETDPTPFFGRSEKKGSDYEIVEKFNSVDGFLTDISFTEGEYEGETKYRMRMVLKDRDGATTFVEANFNNLVYSLLNSLSGITPEFIDLQVWLSKEDDKGKRFPNITVKNNGQKIGWAIDWKDLPQPREEMFHGKKIKIDGEVIDFWKNKILDIKKTLKSENEVVLTAETSSEAQPESKPAVDDLPF